MAVWGIWVCCLMAANAVWTRLGGRFLAEYMLFEFSCVACGGCVTAASKTSNVLCDIRVNVVRYLSECCLNAVW
eukprot:5968167-Lingulodinium_polyedra.AAC.1